MGSDTDLILAIDNCIFGPPVAHKGVSLHRYPKSWLVEQAKDGNLFVRHIAFEGVGLDDPDRFLTHLRASFHAKPSYIEDMNVALLIMKMLIERDWADNCEARRRFFWAVRTVFICQSADLGRPTFSSSALETLSGIAGLAKIIEDRSQRAFSDCRSLGNQILKKFPFMESIHLQGSDLRANLESLGGVARDSVRVVEEREASEEGGLRLYL
ncbi:hypothetical protein [Sphingomonas sp. R3G8C]|uniref:hypothetical protein n=1 Tax=Novosphingobium rhizosphaerae TaxID=1551649 RepID=UPI001797C5C6